jgi:hypothetical protein
VNETFTPRKFERQHKPLNRLKFDSMITIRRTLSTSQLLEQMTYKEAMSSTKKQDLENVIAK